MIGGDTELKIQIINPNESVFDENGKRHPTYKTIATLLGWLDLITGDSKYDYDAKIEDSTHVFICDYSAIGKIDFEQAKAISTDITTCAEAKTASNESLKNFKIQEFHQKEQEFDIRFIDDPMKLHQHLEIYLKVIGGQHDKYSI